MLLSEVTSCLQGKKQGLKLTGKDLVKAISKDSTTLPEQTLIQLENAITSLELSDSDRLTVLPGDVCRLAKLIELLVHGNHLAALPDNLGDLKRLRTLLTHDNQLTALPSSIGELQNLQTLNISQNLLVELPSSFTNLQVRRWSTHSHSTQRQPQPHALDIPRWVAACSHSCTAWQHARPVVLHTTCTTPQPSPPTPRVPHPP
jgi:hypothetical protein